MKSKPFIIVQLVHIEGPLKGEIQEFSDSEILVGRHPSCHVRFPQDESIISRKHARIIREGNNFKLIDQSANGTFVNGKRVSEVYLRDGDVLAITERGPKVSFLTRITDRENEIPSAPSPARGEDPAMSLEQEPNAFQARPEPGLEEPIPLQSVQVPLSIQFGPIIRSFNELPVTIGKSPNCDFTLNHPAILDRHAQIFSSQGEYWVKDLTGQNLVSIDGRPVHLQAPLKPDSHLLLSPGGPQFRFLGGGRLAEIEESVREESMVSPAEKAERPPQSVKKRKSLLDKFFRS